jgi:arylsulfatase A-like enzyme
LDKLSSCLWYFVCCLVAVSNTVAAEQKPWNIVYIMADDMGYGDVGCFDATKIKTPAIDSIARGGMRCTAFYTQPVCGASRTACLTGCYPTRVKQYRHERYSHHPFVHLDEVLVPEVLKPKGYVSAAFGKWDLNGHGREFPNNITPIKHGFDYFYGRPCGGSQFRNEKLSPTQAEPEDYDRTFTDEAIGFIDKNRDTPFFVYLCYYTAHTSGPLAASKKFRGSSEFGLYGDSVQEMDHHIGRLLKKLKEWKLDERTMVIFTSDNGPWHLHLDHPQRRNKRGGGSFRAGSPGPLRGQKTETWEGGVRVPFVIKAPGLIEPGSQTDEIVRIVDMLPTFAELAGAELTQPWKIDGKSQLSLFASETAQSSVDTHYYYFQAHLQAVRDKRFKLVLPRPARPPWQAGGNFNLGGQSEDITTPELYDLRNDIGEKSNIAAQHLVVVERLLKKAEQARADIGDYNQKGDNCRTHVHWAGERSRWLDQSKQRAIP